MANTPRPFDPADDELLSAYVDGELSPAERARVEERLQSDPKARRLVDELRALSGTFQALPRESLGRDLRPEVWSGIAQMQSELPSTETPPRDRWAGVRRGLAWSALAIAATVALMFVEPEDQPPGERDVARAKPRAAGEGEEPQDARDEAVAARNGPPEMRAATAEDAERTRTLEAAIDADAPSEETPAPKAPNQFYARDESQLDAQAPQDAQEVTQPAEASGNVAPAGAPRAAPQGFSRYADSAATRSTEIASAPEAKAPAPPTIEITLNDAAGVAQFEQYLVEHNITFVDERAATADMAGEAVLVEASAAQLADVYAAVRHDRRAFASVELQGASPFGEGREGAVAAGAMAKSAAAPRQSADALGGRLDADHGSAELATDGFIEQRSLAEYQQAAEGAESLRRAPAGRAWRLSPAESDNNEDKALAARAITGSAFSFDVPDVPQSDARDLARSSSAEQAVERPSAGGVGGRDADRTVRVLFLLRRPSDGPPRSEK